VKQATESESEIVFVPYEEAYGEGFEDMRRRVPDTTKIAETLGWRVTASLDEILGDVIDHMRRGMNGSCAMPPALPAT
jgi:UDP-glucose 4-epimerase